MKLNHSNSGGHVCTRLVFVLQLCLCLIPVLFYGGTDKILERIMIGNTEYVMTSYEQRSEFNSLVLGLTPVELSALNAPPPDRVTVTKECDEKHGRHGYMGIFRLSGLMLATASIISWQYWGL